MHSINFHKQVAEKPLTFPFVAISARNNSHSTVYKFIVVLRLEPLQKLNVSPLPPFSNQFSGMCGIISLLVESKFQTSQPDVWNFIVWGKKEMVRMIRKNPGTNKPKAYLEFKKNVEYQCHCSQQGQFNINWVREVMT